MQSGADQLLGGQPIGQVQSCPQLVDGSCSHVDRLARSRLQILDSLADGIYQLDPNGRCTFMNRAACQILGFRFGEAIGQQIHEPLSGTFSLPQNQKLRDHFRRRDGSMLTVEWSCHKAWDASGNASLVISFRDLTDQEAMEARLSEAQNSELRLSAVLNAATDMAGVVLDESGAMLSLSNGVQTVFGFQAAEVTGKNILVLMPEYQCSLLAQGFSPILASGELPAQAIRMTGRHRSGKPVPVEVSFGECVNAGARVLSLVIRDATMQAASEQQLERQAGHLRESAEALRDQTRLVNSIVTSMEDGVIVADEQGKILLYNPASVRIVGRQLASSLVDPETLVGGGVLVSENGHPGTSAYDDLPLVRAIRGESVRDRQLFLKTPQRPNGFWINISGRPMIDDDGVLRGGLVVFRDITERKAAQEALRVAKEEAEAANRAKSEFLSRMSHELRTPMNAILGFAQLLENDQITADQKQAIERILKAGRHLLGLINEVLDLSRIEAGRLNLNIESIALAETVQSAADLVSTLADQRNISLIINVTQPWYIKADRQALVQVLVNFVANAIKYNHVGGEVRVEAELAASSRARIRVSDTGFGMSPEQLKKLFIPFERLGAERTGIEGTGLGLAHCHRLIGAMGGVIHVESEPGKGSRFSVDFPLSEAAAPPANEPQTDFPSGEVSPGFVVCIQDDPASLGDLESIFDRMPGYAMASTTVDEMATPLSERPEIVILDFDSNRHCGFDVLARVRRQTPTETAIIVATSTLSSEQKQQLIAAGARSCVAKPLHLHKLLDTIASLI